MALFTDITTGLQTVSVVGAVPGVYDSSALTTPFEIKIEIASFTGTSAATVVLESSANGTFTDAVGNAEATIPPGVTPASEIWLSFPWYKLAGAAFGSASNKFRLKVLTIAGGTLKIRGMVFA